MSRSIKKNNQPQFGLRLATLLRIVLVTFLHFERFYGENE